MYVYIVIHIYRTRLTESHVTSNEKIVKKFAIHKNIRWVGGRREYTNVGVRENEKHKYASGYTTQY